MKLDEENGLIYTLDIIDYLKVFDALRSYKNCEQLDNKCKLFKFENMIEKPQEQWLEIVEWIEEDTKNLNNIIDKFRFEKKTGRDRGHENKMKDYRKGVAGDWKTYFTPKVEKAFRDYADDLPEYLGY